MSSDQKCEEDVSENVSRFRTIIVDPLRKRGMRKPHAFRSDEWAAELDEVGEDLGGYPDKQLIAFRHVLIANATGAECRTWPNVVAIRRLAHGHFGEVEDRRALDQYGAISDRVVSFIKRHGSFPPPNMITLRDPGLIDALLALRHPEITVEAFKRSGHQLPDGYGGGA